MNRSADRVAATETSEETARTRPALSVVVPVYNQAGSIVGNLATIRRRVAEGLGEPFEVIVVSDGSIDRTEERLIESRSDALRVIHYDRNLGKGYAVKVGALAATGEWIAYVDADLDLDPASIPPFLDESRRDDLDFAIGSKRHPASRVHYPRSRRVASWLYQQLVRVLFRLDVRDTQVGLKVFRREVAEQVIPLLLVKRYAFDLELLAVSRALGFGRVREMPIALDYRFAGSGVRSIAVLRALLDTAAIFYRLRVLRYYQRKRDLLGGRSFRRVHDYRPLVTVIAPNVEVANRFDYPRLELVQVNDDSPASRVAAARNASGEVLAFLANGAVPAGNWVTSALPFLARPEISAVVTTTMAPHRGSVRELAAAAVWESRLGGGSLYFRYTPGNLRFVRDFPTTNVIVRRDDYLAVAAGSGTDLCERLTKRGKHVVYTPESVVVAPHPPLFRPHLRALASYAGSRGAAVSELGWRALRWSTLGPVVLLSVLAVAMVVAVAADESRELGLAAWALYGAVASTTGLTAALRFRSAAVGIAATLGVVISHVTYAFAFARGLVRAR